MKKIKVLFKSLGSTRVPRLHIKFKGHRSVDSGEEDFTASIIYGHSGNVDYVTLTVGTNFVPFSLGGSTSNLHFVTIDPVVFGLFEIVKI